MLVRNMKPEDRKKYLSDFSANNRGMRVTVRCTYGVAPSHLLIKGVLAGYATPLIGTVAESLTVRPDGQEDCVMISATLIDKVTQP